MAETGHAKNIEKMQIMVSACTGMGGGYNPSNGALKVSNLQAALATAQGTMSGFSDSLIPWKLKVNDREAEFEGSGKLATRVDAIFASSGASKQDISDMKGFVRLIKGGRAKKLKVDDPNTPVDESKHNSVSQRSYTQVVEHWKNIIKLASQVTEYNPNEADLKVPALQTKVDAMELKNQEVIDTLTPVQNARTARNAALYDDPTSIYELQKLVKAYVKGAFGASSPQYKQISGLEFTKPRTH